MKKNELPEQIRDLLKKSGKTRYQIAKESNIRQSTIQGVEKDGWGTQIVTAQKLLNVIGYSLEVKKNNSP